MLRKLSIQVDLKSQRQAYVVSVLLKRCPYLQELIVKLDGMDTHYLEEPYPEYSDVDEPFCCLDACLEEVWLSNFMGFDYEMEFAKFIMANARVLKRITIVGDDLCDDLKAALESMQKASSYACYDFGSNGRAEAKAISEGLSSCKQMGFTKVDLFKDGGSVVEHMNEVSNILNQISAMKMVLDDELHALLLLSSLPDS
ncbi:uncharacterized protein LOC131256353 [Magnolia sinica]|uniref:uncharacterized protein LOC131256353 n=1 Tax=Magnolia sinica TaxID=86752 RepID=UPI002659AB62|nr:uncharacterized protein LOC131256353 [Magnolia sinica]